MLFNVHFASVYKGGLFNIFILKFQRVSLWKLTISLFLYWFIINLQTALLHHNWIILYLRTCSNPIGPFSNSMKGCFIVIGPFSTSEQTCTNVIRPFSANELASSWLGPFFQPFMATLQNVSLCLISPSISTCSLFQPLVWLFVSF